MGGAFSKATTIVEAEINSALSVLQKTMSSSVSHITNINQLTIGPGCNFNVDEINMSNYATVEMSTLVEATMDAKFTQDVEAAVKQAADSAAKAGLGIASSESDAITRSITNISAAIVHTIQNIMQSDVINENILTCVGVNVNTRVLDMKNDVKVMMKSVTTSQEVVDAKQSAVLDIAQEVKSLAEGMDPMAILGAIVVVVLVVIGAGLFGVNKVVDILISTKFWFLASLVAMLGGATVDLLRIGASSSIWPYKKDATERNKNILIVSSIVGGIGLVGTVITGFMIKSQGGRPQVTL